RHTRSKRDWSSDVCSSDLGLVGGHCIGVDPYYLTYKAQAIGYHPEIILAGRRLNDNMGAYVASQLIKTMVKRCIQVQGARVLIMGLALKANCPDLRNTRVVDILKELADNSIHADICDPWVDADEARNTYGVDLVVEPEADSYDGIIMAVGHQEFVDIGVAGIRRLGKANHVLYDLKYVFDASEADLRL